MANIIAGSIGLIGAGVLDSLGLGAVASEAGVAITGSEAVGQFVGGATLAKAGQTIAEYAEEGINKAVDYVVPEETQEQAYSIFNDIKSAYQAYESQDAGILIKRKREKNLEMRIKEGDQEYIGKDKKDPTFNSDAVLPYGGNPINTDPDIDPTVHYVDRPDEDNTGDNIITAQQELKDRKVRNISSSELARFIVGYSSDFGFTKNPEESLKQFVEKNPSQLDTVERVNNFLADKLLPTSQEFQDIYAVYNGRSITADSFKYYYDSKGLFHIVATDETGVTIDMPENTGYVLPAVPPYVYVGPFSKNDRPPTNSVIDYFAVFHDYGFRNGINRVADMKFVSRLAQNKDRMRPDEINFANSTILYFSNISMMIGSFVGSQNPEDVAKGPQDNMIMDDIFPIMQPSAKELPDEEYQTARYHFYDSLEKSLDEESVTSSMFAQLSSNSIGQYYAEEFGEILIQLV